MRINSNEMNGIFQTTTRPGVAPNKPEPESQLGSGELELKLETNAVDRHGAINNSAATPATATESASTSANDKNDDDDDDDDDDIEIPSAVDSPRSTTITTTTSTTNATTGSNEPASQPEPDDGLQLDANSSIEPQQTVPPTDIDCNHHHHDQQQQQQQQLKRRTPTNRADQQQRDSLGQLSQLSTDKRHLRRAYESGLIVRRFQKFDATALSSAPSPDVKIGQRVAYKEYYGNEFGTIRWIGRVPQISPDWTVGVEFDNAIGEGDGSLNGRRYFIAKDCFAKFLPLMAVALVDQHVGRPEPGTMISVMSAAVRPGQMISIQRVSTVHVQHCFLNAPHQRPGAEFLAVNTRLHCQCPSCGPCAHVVKPPRTQRLITPKNATHMCQFSTYTCCGMESSDEALCTYTGNKISSLPPPMASGMYGSSLPPLGASWMEGSGYLTNLQAEQRKLMPEEYRLGAAPEDTLAGTLLRRGSSGRRRHHNNNNNNHHHHHHHHQQQHSHNQAKHETNSPACDKAADMQAPEPGPDQQRQQQPSPVPTPDISERRHHKHHHHHHHHHRRHHRARSESADRQLSLSTTTSPVYANLGHRQPIGRLDQFESKTVEAIDMQSAQWQQSAAIDQTTLKNDLDQAKLTGGPIGSSMGLANAQDHSTGDDHRPSRTNFESSSALAAAARDVNETTGDNQQRDIIVDALGANHRRPRSVGSGEWDAAANNNNNDDHDLDDLETAAATRAVQYRDSIENRYLFPTDDIIDSTLEADLETLSQARYGRFGGARSSVSNCPSSEDSQRRWRRRRRKQHRRANNNRRYGGGRRRRRDAESDDDNDDDDDDEDDREHPNGTMRRNIILKGLRSLVVSCLSANEHQSAATTPTNKSNSFHNAHGRHNDHGRHRACCAQHGRNWNPSLGNDYAPAATATECCCRFDTDAIGAHFASCGGVAGQADGRDTAVATNEIVASHHHQQVDQLNLNKASQPGGPFISWAAEQEINANYYMNLDLADVAYDYDDDDGDGDDYDDFDDDNAFECDRLKEETEWAPAVAEAKKAGGGALPGRRRRRQVPSSSSLPNDRAKRQISSSSDCGFSSASQNSMNLTNSNPSCSPTKFSEEEQRRLGQIYKRLATRLASASAHHRDSATSEDLFRLKRALIEIHSESCCRGARCPSSHNRRNSSCEPAEPATLSNNDSTEPTSAPSQPSERRDDKACSGVTELTRTVLADDNGADEPKRELTRAFELKLTLSINPDPTTTTTTAATAYKTTSKNAKATSDNLTKDLFAPTEIAQAARLSVGPAGDLISSSPSG